EQRRKEVPDAAASQLEDARIVGLALYTRVPRDVVVAAVAVALAVGLVVLLVVGDEVVQRETVVSGDEVDAGIRQPAVALVEVAAARESRGHLRDLSRVATPEATDRVAVLPVPLGPAHREVPDLVAAFAEIPGLGDQLHLRDDGVLRDDVEEGTESVHLVELAGERAREVEPEPVDVHLEDPVPQA